MALLCVSNLIWAVGSFGLVIKMDISHLIETLQIQEKKEGTHFGFSKKVPPFLDKGFFLLGAEMLGFLDCSTETM